ncbi:MAG TPA: PrpF domain-containing protein [Negativicutes bacterium]|nr:PrpF domain-containing protein [Negativicutes bacterium]
MIKCSIVRGGTSKAIFIMKNELPADPILRDKVILAIFGSPDLRQINGLGGADITTSKLAIISPATIPEADVDYTFGQVSMEKPFIDYGGNCGNISSGVGPYAIDNGLVTPVESVTTVKIHLTNSGNILIARVPVKNGKAAVEGDCVIGGVPGTGARIEMDWSRVVGPITGKLLPTGHVKDEIDVNGKKFTVSVVDVGNVVIYVNAHDLGLTGTETPAQINADKQVLDTVEGIRGKVCQQIGLVADWKDARTATPYQPFLALVTKPVSYDAYTGQHVDEKSIDLVARMYLMLSVVKAYPGTATACTGAAARIKGSLIWDLLSDKAKNKDILTIGHPTGTISVNAVAEYNEKQETILKKLSFDRTARILMDGYAYVRNSVLK